MYDGKSGTGNRLELKSVPVPVSMDGIVGRRGGELMRAKAVPVAHDGSARTANRLELKSVPVPVAVAGRVGRRRRGVESKGDAGCA